ncbi:hypothetical protein [Haloarcula amylovorans]
MGFDCEWAATRLNDTAIVGWGLCDTAVGDCPFWVGIDVQPELVIKRI